MFFLKLTLAFLLHQVTQAEENLIGCFLADGVPIYEAVTEKDGVALRSLVNLGVEQAIEMSKVDGLTEAEENVVAEFYRGFAADQNLEFLPAGVVVKIFPGTILWIGTSNGEKSAKIGEGAFELISEKVRMGVKASGGEGQACE